MRASYYEGARTFRTGVAPMPIPAAGEALLRVRMIASSRQYINVAPHVAAIPGLAIFLTVLGFNLLGDGLRDALDPRLR